MAKEWTATCKDCDQEFGYSDSSIHADEERGYSRPERCPNCRKKHGRLIRTLGLAYYELQPLKAPPITSPGLQSGLLGGIQHPAREHRLRDRPPKLDEDERKKDERVNQEVNRVFIALRQPECQVALVEAPTGLGKSTFLPYRLIAPPSDVEDPEQFTRHGQVIVTQPRKDAAMKIAFYVAQCVHGSETPGTGYDIGYQYHNAPATDRRNKLVYVTDGILLNWIVSGRLSHISVIFIDEVHERSLNIDLLLGLLKMQLPRFPHLKLIIVSATMSYELKEKFISYFGGEKRVAYVPIDAGTKPPLLRDPNFYQGDPISFRAMPAAVADQILSLLKRMTLLEEPPLLLGKGDILAFLHGEREIESAIQQLQQKVSEELGLEGKVDILPYYGILSDEKKKKALAPRTDPDRFRVVIATNLAETSLTPEGITYVVDSGLIKQKKWYPEAQTEDLEPTFHSQSGCRQRWGRVGRTDPGEAYCLYTKEQFNSFPLDTVPEFSRSSLEQIVLKAKAAGVDDVTKYDWFEKSDDIVKELGRSAQVLRKRNVLDNDDHLTEHGLELHWLPLTLDQGHLLILSDRFACAVEMATLLPMIKRGGRSGILRWDRSWDAATKYAVSRIHNALSVGCDDDLEFCLKIFSAWEGLRNGSGLTGATWARQFFVNHELLKEVDEERKQFLNSLAAYKKSDAIRPIEIQLIDRLRILFAIGLPDRVYSRWDSGSKAEVPASIFQQLYHSTPEHMSNDSAPTIAYTPLFSAGRAVEAELLQIRPSSICFEKPPALIVCAGSRVVRRRISPRQEPRRIGEGEFVVAIGAEWLDVGGTTDLTLAGIVNQKTRNMDGTLSGRDRYTRLMIDQFFPIGAHYECRIKASRKSTTMIAVEMGNQISGTPSVEAAGFEGSVEGDQEHDDSGEGSIKDTLLSSPEIPAKVSSKAIEMVPLNPEADEPSPFITETNGEEENKPSTTLQSDIAFEKPLGLIPSAVTLTKADPTFVGEVVNYTFEGTSGPRVILRPRSEPDPFEVFAATYKVGDALIVEAVTVIKFFNDPLVALLVKEMDSGLEVIMDPDNLAVTGHGFTVRNFPIGQRFQVVIESLDNDRRRVRLSRLPFVLEDLLKLMGDKTERTLSARIVEVHDNGVYVHLEPEKARDGIVHSAFAHVNGLPRRPEATLLGKSCRVRVRVDPDQTNNRNVPSAPEKLISMIQDGRWGRHITFDLDRREIHVLGRMTYAERSELLELSDDANYQRAINFLLKRSNQLSVKKLFDIERLAELQSEFSQKSIISGHVTGVEEYGIFVRIDDDVDGLVRKSELPLIGKTSLRDFSKGDEVTVFFKSLDFDEAQVSLTMIRPEEDPLNIYNVGQIATAVVREVRDKSLLVDLEHGGSGYVPISKMSKKYVSHPSEIASVGQSVKVMIEGCEDQKSRYFQLSMHTTLRSPKPKPSRTSIRQASSRTTTPPQLQLPSTEYLDRTVSQSSTAPSMWMITMIFLLSAIAVIVILNRPSITSTTDVKEPPAKTSVTPPRVLGTPPQIMSIYFPSNIPKIKRIYGTIYFQDPDGDISRVEFTPMQSTYQLTMMEGYSFDPGVRGTRQGFTNFSLKCLLYDRLTLTATLYDAVGNASNHQSFTFNCAREITMPDRGLLSEAWSPTNEPCPSDPFGYGWNQIIIHFALRNSSYIYIYDRNTEGKWSLVLPNDYDSQNFLPPGQHTFPSTNKYQLKVNRPIGWEYVWLFALPRPFSEMAKESGGTSSGILDLLSRYFPATQWSFADFAFHVGSC